MDSNPKNYKRKNSILIVLKIHSILEIKTVINNNNNHKHQLNNQPNKQKKLSQYKNYPKKIKRQKNKTTYNNLKPPWNNSVYKTQDKLKTRKRKRNPPKNKFNLPNKHLNKLQALQLNNSQLNHSKLINKNLKK